MLEINGVKITRNDIKKSNKVFKYITQHLVAQGLLDVKGKTKLQIWEEVISYVKQDEFSITVDYRSDLLRSARIFLPDRKYIACILYATWLEHWINNLISFCLSSNKFKRTEVTEVIRNTHPIMSKYTWLLKLLHYPKISEGHLLIIKQLSELRNSFVHYKWETVNKESNARLDDVLAKVEKTVKYLQSYENKHIYKSTKLKIKKMKTPTSFA
jgi:hypothetical protein